MSAVLKEVFIIHYQDESGALAGMSGEYHHSAELAENRLGQDRTTAPTLYRYKPVIQRYVPDFPVPMILTCPICLHRHIDEGEWATKPHHTHACQDCGLPWRPAVVNTVGVQFLPGFKNEIAP